MRTDKLDTADDIATVDELHVEVNKIYHFKLESRDVLHNFSVPVFRLKQDAIPGRVITGWFEPTIDRRRTTSSAPRSAASATA